MDSKHSSTNKDFSTSSEFCAHVRVYVCGVQSSWTNVVLLDQFYWDGSDIKVTENGLENQEFDSRQGLFFSYHIQIGSRFYQMKSTSSVKRSTPVSDLSPFIWS
jgi:hypothetical protein